MPAITHLLDAAAAGDRKAAAELLPLVYDELRKRAAARLAQERSGQQPAAPLPQSLGPGHDARAALSEGKYRGTPWGTKGAIHGGNTRE
jgi:hypothetical protein